MQATYEAMRQAISKLKVAPQLLLNDAVTIPGVEIPQVPIIKGDAKSASIAAASIVAKVTRDRLMVEYDKTLPGYGFASNKGYGSTEHIEALKKFGTDTDPSDNLYQKLCVTAKLRYNIIKYSTKDTDIKAEKSVLYQ